MKKIIKIYFLLLVILFSKYFIESLYFSNLWIDFGTWFNWVNNFVGLYIFYSYAFDRKINANRYWLLCALIIIILIFYRYLNLVPESIYIQAQYVLLNMPILFSSGRLIIDFISQLKGKI